MYRYGTLACCWILVLLTCDGSYSLQDDLKVRVDFDKTILQIQKSLYKEATVYYDVSADKYTVKLDVIDRDHGIAYGYYNSTLNETGWGVLEISAGCPNAIHEETRGNHTCKDNNAMYAAGLLEGIFTAEQIWQNYLNIRPFYLDPDNKTIENLYRWYFNKQDAWTREMIKNKSLYSAYWFNVDMVMSQFDGLAEGYRQMASPSWDSGAFVLQFLNAVGDLIDLRHYINPAGRPDFQKMTKSQLRSYLSANTHCSALIKATAGFENIFMSHSSWFVYASTMRIYKHYHFTVFPDMSYSLSFSSYPGFLESLDDFYILSNGLVVLQTTNLIFDMKLYDKLTPASLFAWQRVRVANAMATSGDEWAKIFQHHNSGTYNNQYMIIDLKKIKLQKGFDNDALVIVEQIPGLVEYKNLAGILKSGYWASYNVPYFPDIYKTSGYAEMERLHGSEFSYELCPRAKIFRRDAGKVETFQDMMDIMRYNDYKNDSYSGGNACNTICCRGDLVTDPEALKQELVSGCYDTKVTDFTSALQMRSLVINGPTTSHNLPPFSWTGKYASESHIGLPTTYNFGWQPMFPKWLKK